MKKSVIVMVSALFLGNLMFASTPANAAITCAKVTGKAHHPAAVPQPTKVGTLPKTYTLNTNCGTIVISLDPKAPVTVTALTALVNGKYFDNSLCHRLTTSGLYVLQCGDPTLTGSGSPKGWTGYKDENLPATATKKNPINYPKGTVAMANSGANTNGSQFFLVYNDTTLGPNYTIWGKITKGLDILQYVAKQGAFTLDQTSKKYVYAGDGFPVQPVQINSIKVS